MPLRAEQVGSLLRPQDLLAARASFLDGRIDLTELRSAEDTAIREAVARQREIGLDVYADGEMRRACGRSCATACRGSSARASLTSSSTHPSTPTISTRSIARRCGNQAATRMRNLKPPSPATTPRSRAFLARASRWPFMYAEATAA